MKRPVLWLVGDFTAAEIGWAIDGLPADAVAARFASVGEALAGCGASQLVAPQSVAPPAVVVLAQNRPGELPPGEVERLHARYPLALLIMLLGPWCEGEMRTGRPVAGTLRLYWHSFALRVQRLLDDLATGRRAAWALPRIAGENERLMSEITPSPAADALKSSGFVVVRAANVTVFETLAEALAREGHRSAWLDPNSLVRVPNASALVWDAPQLDRPEWNLLDRCRERLPKLPLVMLAGFPRGDDFEQANQREVAALLGKPYRIADLHAALSAAMARREQATASERLRVG